jgi:RimJ/RimL family protein N-acetyltransferase
MTKPTLLELRTERLDLRPLTLADASHMRALLTDPDWIRNIGDRNIHSDEAAAAYIEQKIRPSYEADGFGFLAVIERASGAWLGIAGVVKRAVLEHPDVGFAFLPAARGKGYAREAAAAVLRETHDRLGFARVVAIVNPDNAASRRVLEAIGMSFDRMGPYGDPPEELAFYMSERSAATA